MGEIYHAAFEKYSNGPAKGKQEPVTDLDGINKIHNADNAALRAVCLGAGQGDGFAEEHSKYPWCRA